MTKKEDNIELNLVSKKVPAANELDTASKSLSDALELSFKILKVIMIILVVAFLASGFKTVGPEEEAIVLRFGKIVQHKDGKRTLGPGAHWILPYPIDEMIRIPVSRMNTLDIDAFWYYLTEHERLNGEPDPLNDPNKPLDPLRDGYCLTRSEVKEANDLDNEGNDYNIVHTLWSINYRIDDPELFYRNIQDPNVKQSDIYDDIIKRSAQPFLQNMFEDVVVTTLVKYTIEEAITSKDRIRSEVEKSFEKKLDSIDSGIKVVSVQLTNSEVPRQVKSAFDAKNIASQDISKALSQAKTKAEELLTETAGSVERAQGLYDALHNKTMSNEKKEVLWSQLSGKLRKYLFDARVYATEVTKNAEASAKYLQSLLPEYRQRPDIVINRLYNDTMEKVLANAEEKFIIQPPKDVNDNTLWISLNRDSSLGKKNKADQTQNQK